MTPYDEHSVALAAPGREHTPMIDRIRMAGLVLLRYGLAFILVVIGSYKFFAFEAEGIRPLVSNSPLLAWLYDIFGVSGAAVVIGVVEVVTGLLIATRPWLPRLSAYASLVASGMFLITLSFLLTTPGALAPSSPFQQFLLKDVALLGAALFTAAEALSATGSRAGRVVAGNRDRRAER
jgi:reactive chlorine resistance protein C